MSADEVQDVIASRLIPMVQERERQLKELKNAVTIKALNEVQDVIKEVQEVQRCYLASRLIPMVQEIENQIDSGKPTAVYTNLRVNPV